ncbi:MAG TPA: von Willebrand factor type A domain-containing protein [Tepidisphaeraceae bacterium]|jgi:hypothetical protein
MNREIDQMKLTAYALGELEGAEREAVEARLAASAADRRFVEEVRAAARVITDGLASEETAGLEAIHYAAIELQFREGSRPRPVDRRAVVRGRVAFAVSLAASIVIVVGVIWLVLFSLLRQSAVAVNERATSHAPVLIPLESVRPEPTPAAMGIGAAPSDADPFVSVADHPVSAFALGADTASYDELRQALLESHLPLRESIKIEGLINAFAYDDPAPAPGALFGAGIEIARCPWAPANRLARIHVKARGGNGIVAEDVRTEVAFNPSAAMSYRLIGYEGSAASDRPTARAGERVAAGQAVTALYEIIPAASAASSMDLLTLRVRFHRTVDAPEEMIQFIGRDSKNPPGAESADFRFAAAVAEFGMVVRNSPARGRASMSNVIVLAESGRGADPAGERKRFIELAQRAKALLG